MLKIKFVQVVICFLLIFSLFLSAKGLAGESASKSKILKIGLITSITGPMAPAFLSLVDATKPAAELFNRQGGITVKGQKYLIEIITEDDQSSPAGAIAAINRLMQEGVKFVLPPMFMASDLAISAICEEAKILRMKALGSGRLQANPDLRYSFLASTGAYNISFGYDYLVKHYPSVKKIAIITPDDPGSQTYRDITEKEIKGHGLEIVFKEVFMIGNEDFYPILTKALAKKPDAIDMIYSIVPWAAAVINQSRELGFTGPIYGPALLGDINILNSMLNQKYAFDVFHMGPDVQSPKMLPIVKEFRNLVEHKTKTPLNMDHCIVLEALYDLIQGIEKAQSFNTDKVVLALENMESIDTIYGPGRMAGKDIFGINHVVRRPILISRIVDGAIEFEFSDRD